MSFADKVERACESALAKVGFIVPRRGTINFPISDEFSGWVGLNRGTYEDCVIVRPFIGIHAHQVHRLISKFRGERYRSGEIATYSIDSGSLDSHFEFVTFPVGSDIEKLAGEFALPFKEFAIDYFSYIDSYEELLPHLVELETKGGGYPEKIAVIYYLTGESEKAKKYLNWIISEFEKRRHDAIVNSISKFSIGFIEFIERTSS